MGVIIFLLFCVLLHLVSGDPQQFIASHTHVTLGLTSEVKFRCSVNDTESDLQSVVNIVLSHRDNPLAIVTRSTPAASADNSSRLEVKGNIDVTHRGQDYLEVTLFEPDEGDIGEYKCQVVGLTQLGTVVIYPIKTINMTASNASKADMVEEFRNIHKKIRYLSQENEAMKIREANTTSRISQLEGEGQNTTVFSAGMTQSLSLPSNTVVVFDKIFVNVGGDYNSTSGEFVCRLVGNYFLSVNAAAQYGKEVDLVIQLNDKPLLSFNDGGDQASNSVVVKLSQGDVVKVVTSGSLTSHFYNIQDVAVATFTGYLVNRV